MDLDICPENASKFSKIGLIIRDAINKQVEVQHPTLDHIKTVDLVEFYGPAKSPDATYQNVVVFGEGSVDRSPCGTGTSAKVATLHAKGELLEETTIAGRKAIIPRITGSAYINGFNTFLVDPDDPLKHGFILG